MHTSLRLRRGKAVLTMGNRLQLYTLSSLAKVFLNGIYGDPFAGGSLLKNEEYSFQLGYIVEGGHFKTDLRLAVDSPLRDCITLRQVVNVPSELPAYPRADDNYITKAPGLFPDPLVPLKGDRIDGIPGTFHALWITVKPDGRFPAGEYPVAITLSNEEEEISETSAVLLEIIDAELPEQQLIFTQWFHADCIAAQHETGTFTPAHWDWIEKYMKTAVDNGMNMLLTPVFTPPLDTAPGGERPTIQLVEVSQKGESYRFGFDKLKQWIRLAKRVGIRYFEISHLFTQWGAAHAPKIVEQDTGKPLFGWDTDAGSPEYAAFLNAFLPELTAFLRKEGVAEQTFFHLSDEPELSALESYRSAYHLLRKHLDGFRMIDALSEYSFYEEQLVDTPVVAINHISDYLERDVRPLWAYYCCAQDVDVSNRFFAMPSARNRILAEQLYKYEIEGFLHWGYNFYYSQLSRESINPWLTTDAQNAFPSGDAFSVYPGKAEVIESLRLKVFHEALQDLRAFSLLESRIGRGAVLALIENRGPVTFSRYPREEDYILTLRELVNRAIRQTTPASEPAAKKAPLVAE